MRVLLDRESCEVRAETIGEALSGAAAIAQARGRVIVEVHVDGAAWGERELASPALRESRAEEIRLASADTIDLVRQTLAEASASLVEADEWQRDAAAMLQADREREAMVKLGDALGVWLNVESALTRSAEALGIDLDAVRADGQPIHAMIGRLDDRLRRIRRALESRDTVTLADALLYELPEVVTEWRSVLEAVAAEADDRKSGKPV